MAQLQRPRPVRVSAAAVARAAGVSTAAVSYAMNGRAGVSAETKRHIISVANELGYRPKTGDPTGAQLSRVIGLVLPNLVNPMFTRWAQDITTATAKEGFEVLVTTTQDDEETLAQRATTLAARGVDGVIIAAAIRKDARAPRTWRQRRIPFVYLSRRSDHAAGDFVGIHDGAAAADIMEHLLGHGYSEIATAIGPRLSSASLAREQVFIETASQAGVPIDPQWRVSTELSAEGGYRVAEHLLGGQRRPRAIACGSDEVALGIMEYVLAAGLSVPDDVALVSVDGLPRSRSRIIDLTTTVQPTQRMGERAFELLLDQITEPRTTYTSTVFAHELHIGHSCGCPGLTAASPPRKEPAHG